LTIVLDINCPDCGTLAAFAFAPATRVLTNADKAYFDASPDFKVVEWRSRSAQFYRVALHFPGVSNALANMKDLPDAYSPASWKPVRYRYIGRNKAVFDSYDDWGVLRCSACPSVRRHVVSWPEEAHFQIIYKGESLWAYNRSFALDLLAYLESGARMKTMVSTTGRRATNPFLNAVPALFQTSKARPVVVKALKRKLGLRVV